MQPDDSSRRYWPSLILLIVFCYWQHRIGLIVAGLKPNLVWFQLTLSAKRYFEIVNGWSPEDLQRYRAHFAPDMLHPLIYGLLGWVAVRTSPVYASLSPRAFRLWQWVLPLAAAFDYLENACQLRLLAVPQGTEDWLVPLSGACSAIKWLLADGFVLGFLGFCWRKWRGEKESP